MPARAGDADSGSLTLPSYLRGVLFLLTGSAGSGKSAALAELRARRRNLVLLDLDDLRAPADADASWWREQIGRHVVRAVAEGAAGRDTVLAGWTTLDELLANPFSAALEGIAACLLDCDDRVRLQRVKRRAASGTWRQHTAEEAASFVEAAAEMRQNLSEHVSRLDTSRLSVSEVVDRIEAWMDEQRARTRS